MRKRLTIIFFFVLLFIAFISVWNYSYKVGLEEAYIPIEETIQDDYYIPSERGVFKRFENMEIDYASMPIDKAHERTLDTYYKNRAYPGAPPSIPHPVAERSLGADDCIQCHGTGGFVQKYNAYAPVTPHPELINCRQCHVLKNTNRTFTAFSYSKPQPPKVGKGANNELYGSPPMMPHELQMRENCISCHAGPSAPVEIRVSHPERINCRQCHLPKVTEMPKTAANAFSRTLNQSDEE